MLAIIVDRIDLNFRLSMWIPFEIPSGLRIPVFPVYTAVIALFFHALVPSAPSPCGSSVIAGPAPPSLAPSSPPPHTPPPTLGPRPTRRRG